MNHDTLQEMLWAFHDGQLPPESRSLVESHLGTCTECRAMLAEWSRLSQRFLQPLHTAGSESFVQNVMRRVRTEDQRSETLSWLHFRRWAYPVLAFSMTGFLLAMAYSLPSSSVSMETVLWGEHTQEISTEWLGHTHTEDQILDSVVNNL